MRLWIAFLTLALASAQARAAWQMKVKKGGKTTVTGDAETMERHEQDEKAKAAYKADLAAAPRRAADEPISLVIVGPGTKGRDANLERADRMLADELRKDPLLKVSLSQTRKGGDVYVETFLGTEAALGRKADGKMAVGKAVVYKAEVISAYEPRSHIAKELANLMQTAQMVKELAKKVSSIAKDQLDLPSPKAVAELNRKHSRGALGIEPGDDPKAALKKLFKPRGQ